MDKKSYKKHLISLLLILFFGFAISFSIMFFLTRSGASGLEINIQSIVLYSFLLSLIPAGSYTGFVFAGLKIIEKGKFSKGALALVYLLLPITLAILTILGIILIIPTIIKAVKEIRR